MTLNIYTFVYVYCIILYIDIVSFEREKNYFMNIKSNKNKTINNSQFITTSCTAVF